MVQQEKFIVTVFYWIFLQPVELFHVSGFPFEYNETLLIQYH